MQKEQDMTNKFWKYISSRNFLMSLALPLLMVVYLLYLGAAYRHFSLSGIDGEYVYLLNGLNVAVLRFDNIGFTDHPGTPFLVLTGIFLKLAHLLFGQGNIIDDVIAHPDFYLMVCSMFMLALSTLVLIWGGKKILDKTGSISALLFIQGTYFLSEIVLSMQLRFIVDRFLPLVAFVFSVYTILFLYNEISEKKFAILSGLIMGFGFIAKFSFVVLAFIPPFILHRKNWIRYGWSFLIAAFLSFLPVIDKFGNAKKFILQLFLNKGTYGGGERGIIDTDLLLSTVGKLYDFGENFVWFFVFAVISILIYLLFAKGKKENRKKVLFLIGFLFASIIMAIMVSKNFKDYYLIPTLGVSGIVTFLSLQLVSYYFGINKKVQTVLAIAVFGFLFIPIIGDLNAVKENTKQKRQARMETRKFIDENIGPNNYWFLEPGWISGPFETNGLLWGISYVAGKHEFTENYMNLNPGILTYEGDNKPIKHFRTKDAEIDKIFNEETPVYLFSTPGRRTHLLQQELTNQSEYLQLKVTFDTIFQNSSNNDIIIKALFQQMPDSIISVKKTKEFFNDFEQKDKFWSDIKNNSTLSFLGEKSIELSKTNKTSPIFEINTKEFFESGIQALSISCKYYQAKRNTSSRIVIEAKNHAGNNFWHTEYCEPYIKTVESWENFKYKIYLPENASKAEKLRIYFYNPASAKIFIDDVSITITEK